MKFCAWADQFFSCEPHHINPLTTRVGCDFRSSGRGRAEVESPTYRGCMACPEKPPGPCPAVRRPSGPTQSASRDPLHCDVAVGRRHTAPVRNMYCTGTARRLHAHCGAPDGPYTRNRGLDDFIGPTLPYGPRRTRVDPAV